MFFWTIIFLAVIILIGCAATLRFTFVSESTAKAVVRFGGLKKMIFVKTGYCLDKDNNLVPKPGYKSRFGGLKFVGFWPLDEIYTYTFDWVKIKPNKQGGYSLVPKHEDNVDFIFVGQTYIYGLDIRGNGVVDKDLIPVEVSLAIAAMIINPEKPLFDTTDWFNTFVSLIEPAVRNYINSKSYRDIIAKNKNDIGKDVFMTLSKLGVVFKLEDQYGVKLLSIECKGISLEGKYQEEQTKLWQAQRAAEGDVSKRKAVITALVAMISEQTGLTREEIQVEFRVNPAEAQKKYGELINTSLSLIEQQIAAGAGSLRRYYFTGASGGMDLIALLGEALRGGGNAGNNSGGQGRGSDQGGINSGITGTTISKQLFPTYGEEAERFFKDNKCWPTWDPQHRTPIGDGTKIINE